MSIGTSTSPVNTPLFQNRGSGGFVPPPPVMKERFAILFSSDNADVITDGRGNAIEFRRST